MKRKIHAAHLSKHGLTMCALPQARRYVRMCPGTRLTVRGTGEPVNCNECLRALVAPECPAHDDDLDRAEISATARNYRRSTHVDSVGAADLDVTLTLADGTSLEGEVTLALLDGDYHVYGGQPDHWISGALLAQMRTLSDADFRSACDAIETAAIEAAS